MESQSNHNSSNFSHILNSFGNLEILQLESLISQGYGKEMLLPLNDGNVPIYKIDIEDLRTKDRLVIMADKETGYIYSLQQILHMPINIYKGVNSKFELHFINSFEGFGLLNLDFCSGRIFTGYSGIENLQSFSLKLKENKNKSESYLDLNFQDGKGIKILPGEGKIESINFPNDANPFLIKPQPWKGGLVSEPDHSIIFGFDVPYTLEVVGKYSLIPNKNFLKSFANGYHRPLIPFSVSIHKIS